MRVMIMFVVMLRSLSLRIGYFDVIDFTFDRQSVF
tara:strand:+ start:6817 stop:6921 length:105 start_codon:yes stop_codon:yes gene_type:complete